MKTIFILILFVFISTNFAQIQDTTKENKQFIYILKLTEKYWQESAWDQEASNTVQVHFKHLQDMFAEGSLILAGRTETAPDKTIGICIFEAASLEDATNIAQNDPAVKAGIMTVEVFPYKVALMKNNK